MLSNPPHQPRTASRAPFVLLALLLLSCSKSGESPSETDEPAVWTVSSEPTVTIGEIDGDPEYLLSRVSSGILIPDGRIAVADRHADGIRLFSPDGSFDREIGRRGEGPGEFAGITTIQVISPDTIVAHDRRLTRLTKFLTSGSLVSVHPLQAVDGYPEIYLGQYSNGELGFGWIRLGAEENYQMRTDLMRLARFSKNGQLTQHLGSHTGMIRSGASPLAFSPHLHAEMIGDSIFLTDGLLPEIQVWDDQGALARTIPVPVPDVDPAAAWAALEEYIQTEGNEHQVGWFEGQPRDAPIPRISKMLVDDQDRLWVKKYESPADSHLQWGKRGRGGEWLIMETTGKVLATIDLPEGFYLLDVRGGQILGQIQDEFDVEKLQLFEIAGSI